MRLAATVGIQTEFALAHYVAVAGVISSVGGVVYSPNGQSVGGGVA